MEDPVCKMNVKESGLKTDYKGRRYYFCSVQCKERFDRDPSRYCR